MKQFKTILKFELKNYFHNKVFLLSTLLIVLIIAGIILFPSVKAIFTADKAGEDTGKADADRPIMLLVSNIPGVSETFAQGFPDYRVKSVAKGEKWIKEQIRKGKAECAFVVDALTSYTYYVDDLGMYDANTEIADELLKSQYSIQAMGEKGISPAETMALLNVSVKSHVEKLGQDQMHNFFYTYVMIFALYMVILLYGQLIATNVASEKGSRAMELLITSAKPTNMMFGKVIASCLAGITQMTIIFGSSLLLFKGMGSKWGDNPIVDSIFNIPPALLGYMILFLLLGFFLYGFLFGATGSLASKVEDINTLVMPITLLFVVAFLVVIFSLSSGNVDNLAMQICSYIPFTSPIAMFSRIAMGSVPFYQIAISVALLIVSVFAVGIIAAKIYKVGVLLYGTTPKFSAVIKALKKAEA